MKKLATFVFAFLLAAGLSFAQNTGDQPKGNDTTQGNKKEAKGGKKGHKGGKKGKKSSGGTSTPAPK